MGDWGSLFPTSCPGRQKDGCSNPRTPVGIFLGALQLIRGVLGTGMKHSHAGITWISSMVVPAGSSLGAKGKASKEAPAPEPLAKWSRTDLFSPKMRPVSTKPEALMPAERSLCWDREHRDK